jgi:membrane associated rhomboid family serine protease
MIPIRDATPSQNYPVVNTCIIAANVIVYLVQLSLGADENVFIYTYGLVPARYSNPHISGYFSMAQQLFSFLSFMFLHGGFWHLLGNMWSLYIFGDNVEDRLGPFRYLVFYLLCGAASGFSHMALNFQSNLPTIGASGAIAGVMGAYFILHPNSRILTVIPILIFPWFVEIPAFIFLGFWFVLQFISAAGNSGVSGGVAWWAHIGGFVFGMLLLKLFLRLPHTGITGIARHITQKKKTSRFQFVRPSGDESNHDQYGTITITRLESLTGTQKLVNVPSGFQKKLLRVTVPAGIHDGQVLRLKGQGKPSLPGHRGDLLLKVYVH